MAVPAPPAYLRTKLIPHARQVCQLYKSALYNLKSIHHDILDFRHQAVVLRARFEEFRDIKDPIEAKRILEQGWAELKANKAPYPFIYPTAPGGVAYERDSHMYDFHLDTWHPLEKLQYPDYFARREKRKKEFIERWTKRYGVPKEEPVH